MPAVEFITLFGRLLRDGAMRDALAVNPHALAAQFNLSKSDCAALAQLNPAEVEFQAGVLLRKRLDVVRRVIPETCQKLGDEIWPVFCAYARSHWPAAQRTPANDAHDFLRHLQQHRNEIVCKAEHNRLRFDFSEARFAFHFIRQNPAKPALQLFLRVDRQRWRETKFYFKL